MYIEELELFDVVKESDLPNIEIDNLITLIGDRADIIHHFSNFRTNKLVAEKFMNENEKKLSIGDFYAMMLTAVDSVNLISDKFGAKTVFPRMPETILEAYEMSIDYGNEVWENTDDFLADENFDFDELMEMMSEKEEYKEMVEEYRREIARKTESTEE